MESSAEVGFCFILLQWKIRTPHLKIQVQAIIDRNEKAPELLANLLDDLTALSSHQNINISPFRFGRLPHNLSRWVGG